MNIIKQHITIFFFFFFAFLPTFAQAENRIQFTGGNYVFVENGRLTFNLEHDLFKNRKWKYNEATGAVETQFTTRALDLKTKHSSTFHAYQNSAMMQPPMQPQSPFVKPVLNRAMMQQYHQQPVFLPVVVGFVIRVGGRILINVLPPVIANCFKSLNFCSVTAAVTATHVCAFAFLTKNIELPFGVCEKAEQQGFEKDSNGNYVNKKGTYVLEWQNSEKWGKSWGTEEVTGAPSSVNPNLSNEEIKSKFTDYCQKYAHTKSHGNRKLANVHVYKDNGSLIITCEYFGYSGFERGQVYYKLKAEQPLTMIDLQDLVVQDFKENPNDYINDKGQMGKDLLATAESTQADFVWQSGSGFSIISSPYRDETGETKQDVISLNQPTADNNAKPSGTVANPSAGISNTYNAVTINNHARPDLEADAKAAENNTPNGNNPQGSASGEIDGKEKGQQGNCDDSNADTLGCAKLGDVGDDGSNPNPFGISTSENTTAYNPDNFLPTTGNCPAPKQIMLMGKSYQFSYEPFCQYSQQIRTLVIALAFFVSGFIVFTRKDAA